MLSGWNQFWTDIHQDLDNESTAWRQRRLRDPMITDNDVKTTLAVHEACVKMGLNTDVTITAINMYADRNDLVHSSVTRIIENRHWSPLARKLAEDLRDLPLVTPAHLCHTIPVVQAIIESVIEEHFDTNGESYMGWGPKVSSRTMADELAKGRENKARAIEAERKRVKEAAAIRYRDIISKHSSVHMMASSTGLTPSSAATSSTTTRKRPLSRVDKEDKEERMRTWKRQKKCFDQLCAQAKLAHKSARSYYEQFGSLEAPPPEFWLELGDELVEEVTTTSKAQV